MSGRIYAIETADAVKIGFTSSPPEKRLRQLLTGSPVQLRLIGSVPGEARAVLNAAALTEWGRRESVIIDVAIELNIPSIVSAVMVSAPSSPRSLLG